MLALVVKPESGDVFIGCDIGPARVNSLDLLIVRQSTRFIEIVHQVSHIIRPDRAVHLSSPALCVFRRARDNAELKESFPQPWRFRNSREAWCCAALFPTMVFQNSRPSSTSATAS